MFNYTCDGGKLWRGTLVLETVRQLCKAKRVSFKSKTGPAVVLGWCVEILQACFLVADDIMDKSETRRGQPCWYKLPEVQLDGINDALILESFIYFLLKKHFGPPKGDPTLYIALVELYHEVALQTQLGQMMDLLSNPQGQKGPDLLRTFSPDMHKNIVLFKTAYYTFYLSLASGMFICGAAAKEQLAAAQEVALRLGEKFQIEDDFLDCFADPEVLGKVGTDIQDHKCSWLVVQALKRVDEDQRKLLETHYGHEEPASIAKVKELYAELKLPEVYDQQEEESYQQCMDLINKASKTGLPTSIFVPILNKIHRREK
jgi:farnesyl diphosphate synthase